MTRCFGILHPIGRGKFRNLYRELHGGPYADLDTDTADDHGDEAAGATEIAVGDIIEGMLDYRFDADYFLFQAEKDQKYRFNLGHQTLRSSSVFLYSSEGEREPVQSHELTASGPQILWEAPSSGEYYFAVHNFGGKTGQYLLEITLANSN